jgi:hypothetical protein
MSQPIYRCSRFSLLQCFCHFFYRFFQNPLPPVFVGRIFKHCSWLVTFLPSFRSAAAAVFQPPADPPPSPLPATASLPSVARYASISQLLRFPRRLIPSSRSPIGPGTRSGRRIGSFVCDGIVGNGLDSPLVWVGVFLLGISLRLMRSCF